MSYQRIRQNADLPPPGLLTARAREKQDLDFKTFVDKGHMSEHAKDIAAFANSFGGVLLIGADNKSDPTVLDYPGVRGQTTAEVAAIYEKAGVMCSPAQNVDVVPVTGPGSVDLVAINVDPSVHQVVASPGGQKGGPFWRFPIRRGSQTDDITPEDLAMYTNQPVRRAHLMLEAIPQTARKRVNFYFPRSNSSLSEAKSTCSKELPIEEVPQARNHIVVGNSPLTFRIPLADVIDVWEEKEGVWAVKITGTIEMSGADTSYRPRF